MEAIEGVRSSYYNLQLCARLASMVLSRSIILLSSFQPTAYRDGLLFVSISPPIFLLGGCKSRRRRPWVEVSGVPTTISAEGNASLISSSGAATTRRRSWEESYDLLRIYGDVHGHLNVPQLDRPLGPWVNRQRTEHARYLHNKKILQNIREEGTNDGKLRRTSMTDQRKAMLDEICFVWDAMGQSWNAHYEELCEFRKVYGHCVVPRSNGRLGAWVEKQRVEYKRYLRSATSEGEGGAVKWSSLNVIKITFNNDNDESDEDEAKTILSEDRVNKLDAVNFIWDVRESQFERRIGELRVHRQAIGQMDPQSMNTSLAACSRKYERQYQKFLDEADRGGVDDVTLAEILPENRRVALESVGFCRGMFVESSSTVNEIKNCRVNWEERYEELKEYKAKNGHCVVPKNYGPLGSWVRAQRHSMKEMQTLGSNESGEMPIDVTQSINPLLSRERVERLDRLGFVWDVHQWQWNQTYHELLRYKEEHGNTNAPISFGKLGLWVLNQRSDYNRGGMTPDRLDLLRSIGFEFELGQKILSASEKRWQMRLTELSGYRSSFGTFNVKHSHNPSLYNWVQHQKALLQRNKLKKDREVALKSIGFLEIVIN